jgi:hypothetical protein
MPSHSSDRPGFDLGDEGTGGTTGGDLAGRTGLCHAW